MARPLISLVMIVKNEARGIRETLESAKPYVDRYCLVDTGSTDGTPEIMREAMAGVPGNLHLEPFVDFGTTRSRALDLAGVEPVFTLMLSGDETLHNGDALRTFCDQHRDGEEGAYFLPIHFGPQIYDSARLARADNRWRYVGSTHEVLRGPNGSAVQVRVPGPFIKHDLTHRDAKGQRGAWERDLDLLGNALRTDPSDTRATFYLAQTFECLGRYEQALSMYRKRVELGGWKEEVYEAKFRIARVRHLLGHSWAEVQQSYLDAYAFSPTRAEPLHAIAQHWCEEKNWPLTYMFAWTGAQIAYPKDSHLFVDAGVYETKLADLLATSAYYVGEYEMGRAAAANLLARYPDNERYLRNFEFYRAKFYDEPKLTA